MADEEKRPIIIKKVKKAAHGHHGGAWKVAYADFVTAMMAFFLLLWLLSSAEEETLDGLAEYFTPTIGIKDSAGIGVEGGIANVEDGKQKNELSPPGVIVGQTPQGEAPEVPEKQAKIEATEDAYLFEKAEEAIKQAMESDPNLRDLSDNIIVEQNPEGLEIQIMDSDKNPMFDSGRSVLTQFGRRIHSALLDVIKKMPNFISISGHTDSSPLGRARDYGNWELSSDRANASRRYLVSEGMEPERVKKVQGFAATDPLFEDNPADPKNRRISIILLRGSHMELREEYLPATRDLLSVPGVGPSRSGAQSTPEPVNVEPARESSDKEQMIQDMIDGKSPVPANGAKPAEEQPRRQIGQEPIQKPAELSEEELDQFIGN